jgi:hypothetical protein
MLFLGREVSSPIDLVLGDCYVNNEDVNGVDEFVYETCKRLQNMYREVRDFTEQVIVRRADKYNLRVKPIDFTIGQWVWLYYPRKRAKIKTKWAKFYTGPYQIIGKLGPVLYRIQKSARSQPQVVYVDKLKPYVGVPPQRGIRDVQPEEVDINPSGESLDASEIPETQVSVRPKRVVKKPLRFRT